jgi:hypothetical protein
MPISGVQVERGADEMNRHPVFFVCDVCSKFMSYADVAKGVCYTPYGNQSHLEPPNAEYIHRGCWNGLDDKRKNLIFSIAWMISEKRPAEKQPS